MGLGGGADRGGGGFEVIRGSGAPTLEMRSITRASISRRASGGGGMAAHRVVTLLSLRASTRAARTSGDASVFVSR